MGCVCLWNSRIRTMPFKRHSVSREACCLYGPWTPSLPYSKCIASHSSVNTEVNVYTWIVITMFGNVATQPHYCLIHYLCYAIKENALTLHKTFQVFLSSKNALPHLKHSTIHTYCRWHSMGSNFVVKLVPTSTHWLHRVRNQISNSPVTGWHTPSTEPRLSRVKFP